MGNCCSSASRTRERREEEALRGSFQGRVTEDEGATADVQPGDSAPLDGVRQTFRRALGAHGLAGAGGADGGSSEGGGPDVQNDAGKLQFCTPPLAPAPREVAGPAFRHGTPDKECDSFGELEDTAADHLEFFTVRSSPLSFRQLSGRGTPPRSYMELSTMDAITESLDMSDMFVSCRSFYGAASSVVSGAQAVRKLPSEHALRLSLPPRPATLNDDVSEAAFMSCRSFFASTSVSRDQRLLGLARNASVARSSRAASSPRVPHAHKRVPYERPSSLAASSARAVTPQMRTFSRMDSSRNESLFCQSCISMPSTPFTEEDNSLQSSVNHVMRGCDQGGVQEQHETRSMSFSPSPAALSPLVYPPSLHRKKPPPVVAVPYSLPNFPLFAAPKDSRHATHAAPHALPPWKRNFSSPQSSGPSPAVRRSARSGRPAVPANALPPRPQTGRLERGRTAEAPRYTRGVSCIAFGQQSSWPKLSDIHARSATSLSPSRVADGRASTASHEGLRRGSVQRREKKVGEKRGSVHQNGHGEDDTMKERQQEQSDACSDQTTRGRSGTDAGSSPNTGEEGDGAGAKAAGEADNSLQATNTSGPLYAEAPAAPCVLHTTDSSVSSGTCGAALERSGLNGAGEAGEDSHGAERLSLTESNDMTARTALSEYVIAEHPPCAPASPPAPIVSIATTGCYISSDEVDRDTYGNDSSVNRVGDSMIGDEVRKDTEEQQQHDVDFIKRFLVA